MTKNEIEFAKRCAEDDPHRFYTWQRWVNVREKVLRLDRYECQMCKARKKFKRATTVHHVNHMKKHPELALEIYYTDVATGEQKRNLISLCHGCHAEVHGHRVKPKEVQQLTQERWD